MRIYTRTGDQGETGLFGGGRVRKDSLRVEAYGEVDELNAVIGMALSAEPFADLREVLARLQTELFVLGADLATPRDSPVAAGARDAPRVTAEMVGRLEADIDRCETDLEPLRQFILPGGAHAAATLHLARCVCRRAERRLVRLAAGEDLGPHALTYVNRLSDLLFVLARAANQHARHDETPWLPEAPPPAPPEEE